MTEEVACCNRTDALKGRTRSRSNGLRVDTLSTRAAAGLALSWRETERACATVPLLCRSGPLLSLGAHATPTPIANRSHARSVAVPRTQARAPLIQCAACVAGAPVLGSPLRAPSSCLRAHSRGLVGSWDRGAWSRPGRTNAHEGCGARLWRKQSSERPRHYRRRREVSVNPDPSPDPLALTLTLTLILA